jgi:hypothetical protein
MAMFENQPNRPTGPAPVQPRPITPPPVRPFTPAREPEDIFAGVENTGPKMSGPTGMPAAPRKRGGRRIVLVFVIFIIIILLVAGGVLAYVSFLRQAPVTNTNAPAVNLNLPVNTNANVNTNTNTNINTNVNVNVNQPITPVVTYTLGKDSDTDGLTDIEEALYGTNKDNPDTDGDNYLDGVELIGLYDPTKGGGALLKDSNLIKVYVGNSPEPTNKIYTNTKQTYSIFYPAKWQAKGIEEDPYGRVEEFGPTLSEEPAQHQEFISVIVMDNPDKLSLYEWLLTQKPTADLTLYKKDIGKGGFDELIGPDNQLTPNGTLTTTDKEGKPIELTSYIAKTFYLTKEGQIDKVYGISLNIGNDKVSDFLTTLQMMVSSFELTVPTKK